MNMLSTTFFRNCSTKINEFYAIKLAEIKNEIYLSLDMSTKIKLPSDNTEALIYLRDRIVVEHEQKIWETAYKCESIIGGTIKRQTLENWAKKKDGLIRSVKDSKPLKLWLPDVIFASLIMKAFEDLENRNFITKQAVKEGVVMYKYANLNDQISLKTVLDSKGGIIIDILGGFLSHFSSETLNQIQESKTKLKKAHEMVKNS